MIIGKRLKELRINNKITQQELGDIINVSKVSISGYEKGTRIPSLDTLIELANYFKVSIDYLIGREKKIYNEIDNKFIGYISEQDIDLIYELKHYPNLYNIIIKDIPNKVKQINKRIK